MQERRRWIRSVPAWISRILGVLAPLPSWQELRRSNDEMIRRAGARYTPGIDPDAPNLTIDSLTAAIDGLRHSSGLTVRLKEIEQRLIRAKRSMPAGLEPHIGEEASRWQLGAKCLTELRLCRVGGGREAKAQLEKIYDAVQVGISNYDQQLYELRNSTEISEESKKAAVEEIRQLREFSGEFSALRDFLRSDEYQLFDSNLLLLLGPWGSGKTHFLCDVARACEAGGTACLLFMSHSLQSGEDPLEAACRASGLARTPAELLRILDRYGKRTNSRSLLIFDAINEGDRAAWRDPDYPAPALLQALGLRKRGGQTDLIDAAGKTSTIYREWGRFGEEFQCHLLYLREDHLARYLERTGQNLIWVNWGEREFHYEYAERVREQASIQKAWQKHSHIHKQVIEYDFLRSGATTRSPAAVGPGLALQQFLEWLRPSKGAAS